MKYSAIFLPSFVSGSNPFNTSAQNGTGNNEKISVMVAGQGTRLKDDKTIKGRAKKKIITQRLALGLINVAEKKDDTEFVQVCWNTYHCNEKVFTANGRMYCPYCKKPILYNMQL